MAFKWRRLAAIASIYPLLGPSAALADCAGLARYGIYDVRSGKSAKSQAYAFRNWFCSHQFKSAGEASSAAGDIGFPIAEIPVKLGYSTGSQNFMQWQSSYCSDQYESSGSQTSTETYVATVNKDLVSLIGRCQEAPGSRIPSFFSYQL